QLVPGPINPLMAPLGPPDTLSLPADHTGAFQLERNPPESAWYAHYGALGLKRDHLSHVPIVYNETLSGGIDAFNPIIANAIDKRQFPSPFFTERLPLSRLEPSTFWGGRVTLGYLFDNEAIELTGFYIPPSTKHIETIGQGQLLVPFGPL